jgi:CheY-like chemotaxis protein
MAARANIEAIKILAVEDHEDTRALLDHFLEHCGADVIAVESAWSALEKIQKYNPDVLICDIGLPGLDGYQLLKKIRKLGPEISSIPAIACTAFTSREDCQACS